LQRVIQPAVLEVNGLADFGVQIEPVRKGGTVWGEVISFRMAWWRKDVPDLQAAYSELKRAKVGRMARLRGRVETTEGIGGDEMPEIAATPYDERPGSLSIRKP
jgi:hypothetical protein